MANQLKWKDVVRAALIALGGEAHLKDKKRVLPCA